jgi:hypothetical protein
MTIIKQVLFHTYQFFSLRRNLDDVNCSVTNTVPPVHRRRRHLQNACVLSSIFFTTIGSSTTMVIITQELFRADESFPLRRDLATSMLCDKRRPRLAVHRRRRH